MYLFVFCLFFLNCPPLFLPRSRLIKNFVVLFSVPYTSKLQEATAGEVPVVGSTKQLVCSADKRGYPEEMKAMRWYKDGEKISEGEKYQIAWM